MDGEFIVDRKMEGMLMEIAQRRSINHEIFSNGWVHTFEKGETSAKLIGYKWSINDAAASGIASDKVGLYELVSSKNIPAVEHQLLRTKADRSLSLPDDRVFPLVLKPLTGTSGHGITLCKTTEELTRTINVSSITAWATSPFLKIEQEIRVIVLDNETLLVYTKNNPTEGELPLYNLGKGANAKVVKAIPEWISLALSAMQVSGLRLAAIDIVLVEGEWKILEINDGFMMEHFLRQSDEYYQLTYRLYERVIDALFS